LLGACNLNWYTHGVAAGFLAKALADMGPRRALQREGQRILAKSGLPPQQAPWYGRVLGMGTSALAPSAAIPAADMVDALALDAKDALAPP